LNVGHAAWKLVVKDSLGTGNRPEAGEYRDREWSEEHGCMNAWDKMRRKSEKPPVSHSRDTINLLILSRLFTAV
jgi:hypothetical protein